GGIEGGVANVESTLAGPPCSPPLEKGGRAESLPVRFLHSFPLPRGRGRQAPGWVVTSGHDPPELYRHCSLEGNFNGATEHENDSAFEGGAGDVPQGAGRPFQLDTPRGLRPLPPLIG